MSNKKKCSKNPKIGFKIEHDLLKKNFTPPQKSYIYIYQNCHYAAYLSLYKKLYVSKHKVLSHPWSVSVTFDEFLFWIGHGYRNQVWGYFCCISQKVTFFHDIAVFLIKWGFFLWLRVQIFKDQLTLWALHFNTVWVHLSCHEIVCRVNSKVDFNFLSVPSPCHTKGNES